MTDIAACLIAFERPHYLRETIKSLEALEDKNEVDWFIFQDGAVNKFSGRRVAKDRDVEIANNILQNADLPNKYIERADYNLGIPLQVDSVFDTLRGGYDMVMFFEDDVVVSRYSIRLNKAIVEQYPDSIPTLYTNRSIDSLDSVEDNLDILMESETASFHTFAMTREVFKDIEEEWNRFIEVMRGRDYEIRNHKEVRKIMGTQRSSTDSLLQKALLEEGYYRVRPLVSRALYIGMEGIHSRVENYQRQFEGNVGEIHYEQDADPPEFRLHERSRYQ